MLEIRPVSNNIHGMPVNGVLDVLKKLGMSKKQLRLADEICYKLKAGDLSLKDVNKLAEGRNFKLLNQQWSYQDESLDPVLALRKFELAARTLSCSREEHSTALAIQIGKVCNIDLVTFIEGSIRSRRADPHSDVDLRCIVGASEDVPKLKLLIMLATYCSGEVICPSILTGQSIRSKDELYTAATYHDPSILNLYWLNQPCGTTSDDFLEEIRLTMYSSIKKFHTYSSLYEEAQNAVRSYGISFKRKLFDGMEIKFRSFLKLLDLGFKYACLKRGGLAYAAENLTFWERIQTILSKTEDYKKLEWALGSLLIDAGGDPRGSFNLIDKNFRGTINQIMGKYCIF